MYLLLFFFFFFNDTATTEIYTLSLHDALPILAEQRVSWSVRPDAVDEHEPDIRGGCDHRPPDVSSRARSAVDVRRTRPSDRKSTRLNSSHANISYAVFCLKKKKKQNKRYDSHI